MNIALRLWNRHAFMWQSVDILNVFNTLTLKEIFWKTKTFFKKLENDFLVESTDNALFPYKTVKSEANFKTNRMVSTKWNYHRERNFACNYFWNICFIIRTSFKELIWCRNYPNVQIDTFRRCGRFIWGKKLPCALLLSLPIHDFPQFIWIFFSAIMNIVFLFRLSSKFGGRIWGTWKQA